jgi:hypothetical protein
MFWKKKTILNLTMLILVMAGLTQAGTITVGKGGGYDFTTIQAGIDDAVDGDTVLVKPGVYIISEPITFKGKVITVQSEAGPDTTTIEMDTPTDPDNASVVAFTDGEGPESVLAGFTITGGTGTRDPGYPNVYCDGGGIFCYLASPTIEGNVIVGNDVPMGEYGIYGYGGGIMCLESSAVINRNIIKNNSGYCGGGIFVYMGDARITCNLIYDNSATYSGGVGLRPGGRFIQFINNTLVANNATSFGGNIRGNGRCLILNNIITEGTASYGGSGLLWNGAGPLKQYPIAYNNVYNNTGGNYYGIEDQTGINGNISEVPLFVSPDTNDYHLQADSPCINSADPAFVPEANETDIDGEPRVLSRRADIGADEYVGYVRPIADAGPDQFKKDLAGSVTLDGSGSYFYDSNGTNEFHWTQIEGPTIGLNDANSGQPTFVPSDLGIYVFELQVSDASFQSLPDRVTVVVGTDHVPIADAGLPRYAATDPVELDGTGSYDRDKSGSLSYHWQQISGPSAVITDSNTATPTISGFMQKSVIQKCEFELVVNDGSYDSLPDIAVVKIVPNFGTRFLELENASFDPDKPTVIYFGGGDCYTGFSGQPWNDPAWSAKANVISFPNGYFPDGEPASNIRTYCRYGDMILVYLSSVAPDYKQPIQTMGWSTGGQPAVDVARYLNLTYADPRYAVNRIAALDVACRNYYYSVSQFLASAVDGEQCWRDAYWDNYPEPIMTRVLHMGSSLSHVGVRDWYRNSLADPDMNQFNGGVVAGAYWSVVGTGKNLQLASESDGYYFSWTGTTTSGYMSLYNEPQYPGRLPEPVTLVGPSDGAFVDANGAVLSCQESENAVGYQLLFGPDPYQMVYLFSDTPTPPNEVIAVFPFQQTWWTVKVRDQYGSTIYADPICINAENVIDQIIENTTTGKKYYSIQIAINEAVSGHELAAAEGIYLENIDFKGKNLTVRSVNPDDPAVVAATVIDGGDDGSVVTFSNSEDASCVLSGFTITGGNADRGGGIYCTGNSSPTITKCIITNNSAIIDGGGMYSEDSSPTLTNCSFSNNSAAEKGGGIGNSNSSPTLTNCTFMGNSALGGGGMLNDSNSSPTLTNCTFTVNSAVLGGGVLNINNSSPTLSNCILWGDTPDEIYELSGSTPVITYSDVQGGWSGSGNINADPCFVDPGNDDYHLLPNSVCIDSGDSDYLPELNETDLDGHPRVIDGDCNDTEIVDMGAYEFNYAYMGDLDYDCDVDFDDFAILGLAWMTEPPEAEWDHLCDISSPVDNYIDWHDMAILCANWLAEIH